MTATGAHTAMTPRDGIKPGERAPELAVELVGSGRWRLAERHPENFTRPPRATIPTQPSAYRSERRET